MAVDEPSTSYDGIEDVSRIENEQSVCAEHHCCPSNDLTNSECDFESTSSLVDCDTSASANNLRRRSKPSLTNCHWIFLTAMLLGLFSGKYF